MTRVFFGRKAPPQIEIVYAAGLFDGEGSIAVARAGEMAARIQMADVECLERLQTAFGGNLYRGYDDRRKCKDGSKRKAIHQLSYNGYEALWFLKIVVEQMRNPRQIKRTRWLLKNWDVYSKVKGDYSKPPRWQMYIDFHTDLPGGNRKNPLDKYARDRREKSATARFNGNTAQLKRRNARYKINRLKRQDYVRGPYAT